MKNIRAHELAKLFFDFENENVKDISKIFISGWLAWTTIKTKLYYHLYHNANTRQEQDPIQSDKLIIRKTRWLISDVFKLLLFFVARRRKALIYLFAYDVSKTFKEENKYVNVTVDTFRKLNHNCIYIEAPYNNSFKNPSLFKRDLSNTSVHFLIAWLAKYLSVRKKYHTQSQQLNTVFKKWAQDRKIECDDYSGLMLYHLHYFHAEYVFYRILFTLIKPELVITTDQLGTGKIAAAKQLGIPVLELQHGVIEQYKIDYCISSAYRSFKQHMPIPSVIGLFGEYYKNIVFQRGFWEDNELYCLGNFRMSIYRKRPGNVAHKPFRVLFITQWTHFSFFNHFLDEFLQYPNSCEITIKLHPQEPAGNIQWYKQMAGLHKLKLAESEYDIYDLIINSDIVVGFDSASLLEAIALQKYVVSISYENLPDGMFTTTPGIVINNIDTSEICKIISSPYELIKLLKSLEFDSNLLHKGVKENISKFIYEENYEENCRHISNLLLKKN